jgi:hypothetical protein
MFFTKNPYAMCIDTITPALSLEAQSGYWISAGLFVSVSEDSFVSNAMLVVYW